MKRLLLVLMVVLLAGAAMAENNKWTRPTLKQVIITPSDVTIYKPPLMAVQVNEAGNVRVIGVADVGTYTCANAPIHIKNADSLIRVRTRQICATGTDVTNMIGFPAVP